MNRPFDHCTKCGARLVAGEWPNRCPECGATHYLNPFPVSVLIQPVEDGLLTVRRAIDPGRGKLALPGGFIDVGESWQEAAVRELAEETSVAVQSGQVELFDAVSAPDGTVLIFGVAPSISTDRLSSFEPSDEVAELVVLREPMELAFPIHTEVVARWFRRRDQDQEGSR